MSLLTFLRIMSSLLCIKGAAPVIVDELISGNMVNGYVLA